MLAYRVFPHVPGAAAGAAGHATHVSPDQGMGRWDNPDLYPALYLASTPTAAVGESFARLSRWTSAMLRVPGLPGATRRLGIYEIDEDATPLLDLDDAKALVARSLRPTEVVIANRPRTQAIARGVHGEQRWSGLSWWSAHRPQWVLHVLFGTAAVTDVAVQDLPGHPGLADAAERLARPVAADLLPPG